MKTFALYTVLIATLCASICFADADPCTVLSGGRELLSARKTVQVGNTYYNLAITVPDLIAAPGSCVSTPPVGIVDPVLSIASMGTNTFSLPANSRAQLVVSKWVGSDLQELARVSYSTILVSKVMVSVLIVPVEDVYYDFSGAQIQGNFASLPHEVTSFYEIGFRFFLDSGPASFTFHEPDPANPGQDLSLQGDEAQFQYTTPVDDGATPAPANLH